MKNSINKQNGVTLIEILVVIGVLGMLLVLGSIVNLDSYKSSIFRSERMVLVSHLTKARNQSMNNINEVRHGLCYDNSDPSNPKYVLFEGNSYGSASVKLGLKSEVAVTLSPVTSIFFCNVGPGVVFDQLTGRLYPPITPFGTELVIGVTEEARTSNISINNEGRINW